jgi:hypothetical protein
MLTRVYATKLTSMSRNTSQLSILPDGQVTVAVSFVNEFSTVG